MMEESQIFTAVVNDIVSLNYDDLDKMIEQREDIGSGMKENIKTLKEYIYSIISNSQDTENNLQFYKRVIADLGRTSDLPKNYLDSDILVSQYSRNDIRPLFEKVTQFDRSTHTLSKKIKEAEEENEKLKSQVKQSFNLMKSLQLQSDKGRQMEERFNQLQLEIQQGRHKYLTLQSQNKMINEELTILNNELLQKNKKIQNQSAAHNKEVEQFNKKIRSIIEQKNEEKNKFLKTISEHEQLLKKKEEEIQHYYEQMMKKSSLSNQIIEQCAKVFIRSNSLVSSLGLNESYSTLLLKNIKQETGKTVRGMESLYNYSIQKKENFHNCVDNKENILLICQTEEKEIVGGFTSSGFSLNSEDKNVKNVKAFLFNLRNNEMNIFRLKQGRKSTVYDWEYLLFGNQELSIEKGSNELSSYFVSGSSKQLHFQGSQEAQQTFLSMEHNKREVRLQNYEIVQVIFEE